MRSKACERWRGSRAGAGPLRLWCCLTTLRKPRWEEELGRERLQPLADQTEPIQHDSLEQRCLSQETGFGQRDGQTLGLPPCSAVGLGAAQRSMASPPALLKIPNVQQPELLRHQNSKFSLSFFFFSWRLIAFHCGGLYCTSMGISHDYIYLYPCPFEPPSPSTPIPPL